MLRVASDGLVFPTQMAPRVVGWDGGEQATSGLAAEAVRVFVVVLMVSPLGCCDCEARPSVCTQLC